MNFVNLISKQCFCDLFEVFMDEQVMFFWGECEVVWQVVQNMVFGVVVVGNLLVNVGVEGEVGQEILECFGWFLEEIGGGIFQLVEFEQVFLDCINWQKEWK